MTHEFRESPYAAGICAACGRPASACEGFGIGTARVAAILNARPEEVADVMGLAYFRPLYSVPLRGRPVFVTPDVVRRTEELVARVALLRLEAGDDAARREFYGGWAAYDEATARASFEARDAQTRAEVYELERWRAL